MTGLRGERLFPAGIGHGFRWYCRVNAKAFREGYLHRSPVHGRQSDRLGRAAAQTTAALIYLLNALFEP
jgi:hypothetical protein